MLLWSALTQKICLHKIASLITLESVAVSNSTSIVKKNNLCWLLTLALLICLGLGYASREGGYVWVATRQRHVRKGGKAQINTMLLDLAVSRF